MYLFVNEDGFGFKVDGIHEILETDIQISDEVYNRFFELQSQGKQFKVKNPQGTTFEEIFEEVIPEPIPQPPSEIEQITKVLSREDTLNKLLAMPSISERLKALEDALNFIIFS